MVLMGTPLTERKPAREQLTDLLASAELGRLLIRAAVAGAHADRTAGASPPPPADGTAPESATGA